MKISAKEYGEKVKKKYDVGVRETAKLRKMLEGAGRTDPEIDLFVDYFRKKGCGSARIRMILFDMFEFSEKTYREIYETIFNEDCITPSGNMYLKVVKNPNCHNYGMDGKVYRISGRSGVRRFIAEDCYGWRGNNIPTGVSCIVAATDEEILEFIKEEIKLNKEWGNEPKSWC